MRRFSLLIFLLVSAAGLVPASAQLTVGLQISRRLHMIYEPVLATVSITNMSGRELTLEDSQQSQWFGFQITSPEGRLTPPRNPDYHLDPLHLQPGETVKRTVNLNDLYSIGDFGPQKIRAAIYSTDFNRFFTSIPVNIELTDGRTIWKQTVGVPDALPGVGGTRQFSLLTLELEKGKMLYVRVEGVEDGKIYGCYQLGRLVHGVQPETMFDAGNNLWILQLVGEKTYFLTKIGVGGEFAAQSTYVTPKSKPFLRKQPDGTLQLVGAVRQPRTQPGAAAPEIPKLSDRPPGFPTTEARR